MHLCISRPPTHTRLTIVALHDYNNGARNSLRRVWQFGEALLTIGSPHRIHGHVGADALYTFTLYRGD